MGLFVSCKTLQSVNHREVMRHCMKEFDYVRNKSNRGL